MSREVGFAEQMTEAKLHCLALQDIVDRCRHGKIKRSDADITRYCYRLQCARALVATLEEIGERRKGGTP